MIKYINSQGNVCRILHFPGDRDGYIQHLIKSFIGFNIKIPDNLQVITTVDNSTIDSAALIKQLENSHIDYINSAENKDTNNWSNRKKIQLIYDTLCTVEKEYCLILDGWDVGIVGDLSNVIDLYKTYNVKVLYNATVDTFPPVAIESIANQSDLGVYGYFNAGCCIGETQALKAVYKRALDIIAETDLTQEKWAASEQYWLRKVYAEHTEDALMGIDYQCKIFQVWHRVKLGLPKILGPNNIVYELSVKESGKSTKVHDKKNK